jgi:outer membrane protein TolC
LEVERLTEQLRLDVSNDYYDAQEADEQVRINRAAVDNSQASLRDAQALERAGLGTRFDVLQAQVQLANDTQELTQSFSQQRIARRQLAQRLSLGSSADVSPADPVAVAARWNRSLEESTLLAFQNRAELGQQLAQRNISEQNRRIALADLGPQVSIVASYNAQNIFQDNSGNAFTGGAFTGFIDNFAIGPRVTLNIFEGGAARARAAQEEANIRIAETNFANTRNQVRFAVEQAFFNLDSSFRNIQTASVAVDQARESLRLARLRFQAGVGIQSDVLDAVAALTQAQGNRVTAILGYNRALVSLQREISNLQVTAP